MKREVKARAYAEAARILAHQMDLIDLPEDLSEKDEDSMREFIRNNIADGLSARAARLRGGKDPRR